MSTGGVLRRLVLPDGSEYDVLWDGSVPARPPNEIAIQRARREQQARGAIVKACRVVMRGVAAHDPVCHLTQSHIRRMIANYLGRDVSSGQVNSALWVLQQNQEVERTGAKKGGVGHSWSPDETTYRWKGATDATPPAR